MDKSSIHFRESFFEEILNGIPKEESKDEILISVEEGNKTNLSPDNKLRIKNVVKAFLNDEESKKIFINTIKNIKNREKTKWINQFNLKFLVILKENEGDQDEEDDFVEDVADEEKSKGFLSSFRDLKKKYETIEKWKERQKRLRRMIYILKDSYVFLNNITFASLFGSKTKLVRDMNTQLYSLFHTFKPNFIDPLLYSGAHSLSSIVNLITKEIKNKVSAYYSLLEELMHNVAEDLIITGVTRGGKSILKYGHKSVGIINEIIEKVIKGDKKSLWTFRGIKFSKFLFDIISDEKKRNILINTFNYGSAGLLFSLTEEFSPSDKKLINDFTQKIVNDIRKSGDKLAASILNGKGISVSSAVSSIGIGEGFGEIYNEGNQMIGDQIKRFGDTLVEDLETNLSTQDKFDVGYQVMKTAYIKSVEKSPWTKAIEYLGLIVKFSQNLFNPFLDNLKSIAFENRSIFNTLGVPLNIDEFLKKIVYNGLTITDVSGNKTRLINRLNKKKNEKSINQSSSNSKVVVSIQTKQSVVNTIKTKDGKVVDDTYGKKEFNPVLNINISENTSLTDNFKFYTQYNIRDVKNETFKGEEIQSSRLYNTSNNKLNSDWLNKINIQSLSSLGYFFHHLFDKYKISDISLNDDFSEIKSRIVLKAHKTFSWFGVINHETKAENFMLKRIENMCDNISTAYNSLNHLDLNSFLNIKENGFS